MSPIWLVYKVSVPVHQLMQCLLNKKHFSLQNIIIIVHSSNETILPSLNNEEHDQLSYKSGRKVSLQQ